MLIQELQVTRQENQKAFLDELESKFVINLKSVQSVLTLQGNLTKSLSSSIACLLPEGGGLTCAAGFFAEDGNWFCPFFEPFSLRAVSLFGGCFFFTVALESTVEINKII